MTIEVRRASDRFVTRTEGRTTWHSFSFGAHYDPHNTGFGTLVAHNDEYLPPGTGYPEHPHRDLEIVTIVLEGALRHTDSSGSTDVLLPGDLARTSAGAGIVHSEVTEPGTSTRFLQAWLRPDEAGGVPSYAVAEVGRPQDLSEVVGPAGATDIGAHAARLFLAHAEPGELLLPDAPCLHVFVADGGVMLGERELAAGDAARLTGEGGRALTVELPGLVLVWAFDR